MFFDYKHLNILLLTLLDYLIYGSYSNEVSECEFPATGVAAAVHPVSVLENNVTENYIEIYWWGIISPSADDTFQIWSHDPNDGIDDPLDSINFSGPSEGHTKFSTFFDPETVPVDVIGIGNSTCLPYWVGFVKDGTLALSCCLRINPNWMRDLKDIISPITITEVIIPGTHDAGAITLLEKHATDGTVENVVSKWTFTQDRLFWTQLVMGVRYLDMRISYYPELEHLIYVNHGPVRIAPLYLYLEDIQRFLAQTDEILIFDIHLLEHNFYSYPEAEGILMDLLQSYLLEWMVPNTLAPNPTLESLWNIDRRIIVTYPNETTSNLYWRRVHHVYGDVNNLDDLFAYFNEQIPAETNRGSLWSAMTEFTPSALDVSLDRWDGLTGAAEVTNFPVTTELRNTWWKDVNIIAMDFVLGSDVINTVIEANKYKHNCI